MHGSSLELIKAKKVKIPKWSLFFMAHWNDPIKSKKKMPLELKYLGSKYKGRYFKINQRVKSFVGKKISWGVHAWRKWEGTCFKYKTPRASHKSQHFRVCAFLGGGIWPRITLRNWGLKAFSNSIWVKAPFWIRI